jgi:predicted histidine transporter YuiF (NhaC family)
MLGTGFLISTGIGSSFSTVSIVASVYVPLCIKLGISPMATAVIVAMSGVCGDAGSPASDSTLGPTMGLNADGQHDHMTDTVIPAFFIRCTRFHMWHSIRYFAMSFPFIFYLFLTKLKVRRADF